MPEPVFDLDAGLDAREFLLAERPAFVRGSLWLALLLLGGATAWSCVARFDLTVSAPGVVRPTGDTVQVQAPLGGVVADVASWVKEGASVESGSVLLRLDASALELERTSLCARLAGRRAVKAETRRARQDELAQARLELEGERKRHENAVAEAKARLATVAARRDAAALRVRQAEAKVKKTVQLVDAGFARPLELEEDRSSLANLRAALALVDKEEDEARIAAQVDDAVVKIAEAKVALRKASLDELDVRPKDGERLPPLDAEIASLEQDLAATDLRIRRATVRAPLRGTITRLAPLRAGRLVGEASFLVELLPEGSRLVLEATIKNGDRGRALVGRRARVRFAAFRPQEFGALDGEVESVSLDALGASGVERSNLGYKATIELPRNTLMRSRRGEEGRIQLGMVAEADIVVERRPAIAFVVTELQGIFDQEAPER